MRPPTPRLELDSEGLRALLPRGVSYVGPLDALSHETLVELVREHGGRYVRYGHYEKFDVLIVGDAALPITPGGDPFDFSGRTVVRESDFLTLLGEAASDAAGMARSFTPPALSELLHVPEPRIRAWAKAGLLRPTSVEHGVMRFDFRQAAIARTLVGLTDGGVSASRLRRSLKQLKEWLPGLDEPLQQLSLLERNGPLLVRLENGDLAEVDGQMHLDFNGASPPPPAPLRLAPLPAYRSAGQWHALGIEQEQAGLLDDAADSYLHALQEGGPDPQVCFDLAHVLAESGHPEAAIERYRQVTELDPRCGDAWNNLAVLLGQRGDGQLAIDAFRRAVRLSPDDAAARYNLADALDDAGSSAAADEYQEYLRLDPSPNPWADHARRRVAEMMIRH